MLTAPEKPLIAIVGGAKVSDKIKLIDALIDRADGLIICGGMAYTFLKVCFGMQIGKSLFDKNGAEIVQSILDKAKVSSPPRLSSYSYSYFGHLSQPAVPGHSGGAPTRHVSSCRAATARHSSCFE